MRVIDMRITHFLEPAWRDDACHLLSALSGEN